MAAFRTAPGVTRLLLAALALLLVFYAAELAFDFLPADVSELFQKFATNIVFLGSAILCACAPCDARASVRPG
jgi:hypothetical protein